MTSTATHATLVFAAPLWGVILYLATSVPGWHWLVWIAIAPSGWLVSPSVAGGVAYSAAFVATAVFHLLGLSFLLMALDGAPAPIWFFHSMAGALCFVTVLAWSRLALRGRWPMVVALPLLWVTFEYVRQQLFAIADGSGFPMLWLGTGLVHDEHLRQIADLASVLGLTALVAVVNGAVLQIGWAIHQGWRERWAKLLAAASVGGGALGSAWVYGAWRIEQTPDAPGPTVALVSAGFVEDPARFLARIEADVWDAANLGQLRRQLLGDGVDLYVWPEQALAAVIETEEGAASCRLVDAAGQRTTILERAAQGLRGAVLAGANRTHHNRNGAGDTYYNSVICVDRDGTLLGFSDKTHLMSYFEHTPRWCPRFAFPPLDDPGRCEDLPCFQAGEGPRAIPLVAERTGGDSCWIGPLVCFDTCFADVHRSLMRSEHPPDVFVCVMQESFDRTNTATHQSFLHARLRAVEFRRPYCRVSRGGLTGAVDSCGRVLAQVHHQSDRLTIVAGRVPLDRRRTLFARYGNWLPAACSAVLGMLAIAAAVGRRCRTVDRTSEHEE